MLQLYIIFPAIYRLFISKPPPGFVRVISLSHNCFGHTKRQIVGSSASFTGSQPPPTPSPDASTQPRNSGSPMTNYFTVVGSREPSFSSILQSQNTCFATGKYFYQTIHGFTWRILLIGVIKLFPVGTAVAACRILSIKISIFLNWTPFVMLTICCSSESIALWLSCASSMHRVVPPTVQPSNYFLTIHWPSPDSNFFLDIGYFPLCTDTCGGGNMLCIPCSNYLDKWSNCAGSLVCAMCIIVLQNTSSMVQNGFPPIEFRTYYNCLPPTCSHFQGQVVLILYFPQMDDPEVSQHVCEHMIPLCHVLFLTPHGRSKVTMSTPFTERAVLPTR